MSDTLYKKVDYTVSKLVEDIGAGEIGLPDIQRPFVWGNSKVRDLFDSMYNGYPVGYLLFWRSGAEQDAKQIGTGEKQSVARLLIVDGQQRLTSIFAVIKGEEVIDSNYRQGRIKIAFRPRDGRFEVADAAIERDSEFISDISEVWAASSITGYARNFVKSLRESREVTGEEEDLISDAIGKLHHLDSYPFTALELSAAVNEEQVADVFVRINSKGKTLNQADFILTLMSVWWDEGRSRLEQFCREARSSKNGGPSPANYFIEPDPDQLLRVSIALGFRRGRLSAVYQVLRGRDVETGVVVPERRDSQFEFLQEAQAFALNLDNWHEFMKCLMRAGYTGSRMVTSNMALLYSYALFLIGKRDYQLSPDRLRDLIARWFFTVSLTGRYSASPESQMETDLSALRDAKTADDFAQRLEKTIADTLTADFWRITLPNALATPAGRSPSQSAYFAALNVLDARVLFSKLRVKDLLDPKTNGNRASIERHHLFPKAYLATLGITSTRNTNQIANYALVEWPDNSAISDAPPAEYFPALMTRYAEEEQQQIRRWHALPPGWETMPYDDFLEARRLRMAEIIREGFTALGGGDSKQPLPGSLDELVDAGESERLEFKSTGRVNTHTGERDERMELAVVRTVAGLANNNGGTLLIGVNDDGEALGIDADLKLVKKHDVDGFELWLTDLLEKSIGKAELALVRVHFPHLHGRRICRVDVQPSGKPIFVRGFSKHDAADFYVRVGNSTRLFNSEEMLKYRKEHWGVA